MSNVEVDLEKGASLCRQNALRYHEDARILFENESYGHSFLLGTLCLEELGKYFLLLSLKDALIPYSCHLWKIIFGDHTFKNLYATMVLLGVRNPPEIFSVLELKQRSLESASHLVKFRQWSQYVDYAQGWRSPLDSEFETMAKEMLLLLPLFLNIEPPSKEEHLKHIQEVLSDPEKVRELEALSSTVLPAMRRALKRVRGPANRKIPERPKKEETRERAKQR